MYRVLLTRHGRSLGQAHLSNYVLYGDAHVPLDPQYVEQSYACGQFLRTYFNDLALDQPPVFRSSEYKRAIDTLSYIKGGLGDIFGSAQVMYKQDYRLNEQCYGLLSYGSAVRRNPFAWLALKMQSFLSQTFYKRDPFTAKPPLGESPKETLHYVEAVLKEMRVDMLRGSKTHVAVSHGAVMKAFLIAACGLSGVKAWPILEAPGNNDVYELVSEDLENWSVRKIYDGATGQSLLDNPKDVLKGLKPVMWSDISSFTP